MLNAIFQPVREYLARRRWRKHNSHNKTVMKTIFPMRFAKVGQYSYGDINLIVYNERNTDSRLEIGNFVSISGNVTFLLCEQHHTETFTSFPLKSILNQQLAPEDAISRGSIVIEDEVWIGYGVTILSGVRIGKGSIIATGAVVTKDVSPYSVVGGVPARLIGNRFDDDITKRLMKLNLIDLSISVIKDNIDVFYKDVTIQENLENVESVFNI